MNFTFDQGTYALICLLTLMLARFYSWKRNLLWLIFGVLAVFADTLGPKLFVSFLALDTLGALLLVLERRGQHRSYEAMVKFLIHQYLATLLLLLALDSLSPSLLYQVVLFVGVAMKLGLFPFYRSWVDFVDGCRKSQALWMMLFFRAAWVGMLYRSSLLSPEIFYISSLAGIAYFCVMMLPQSNVRRMQAYYAGLVLSVFILLLASGVPYSWSLSGLMLFASLIPKAIIEDDRDYLELSALFGGPSWQSFLTVFAFLAPVIAGVGLMEVYSQTSRMQTSLALVFLTLFPLAVLYRILKAIRLVKHHGLSCIAKSKSPSST